MLVSLYFLQSVSYSTSTLVGCYECFYKKAKHMHIIGIATPFHKDALLLNLVETRPVIYLRSKFHVNSKVFN